MHIPQGKLGLRKEIKHAFLTTQDTLAIKVFPDTNRPLNLLGYYNKRVEHLEISIQMYLVEKHNDYYTNPVDLTYLKDNFESYCSISKERFEMMSMYEKRNLTWIPAHLVTIPEENRFGKYTLDRME